MNRKTSWICALLLTAMLAGCADNLLMGTDEDQARFLDPSYLTFDHDLSEKSAADVRARAERICSYRKGVAVETQRACTMQKCATSYQCVKPMDAKDYGL